MEWNTTKTPNSSTGSFSTETSRVQSTFQSPGHRKGRTPVEKAVLQCCGAGFPVCRLLFKFSGGRGGGQRLREVWTDYRTVLLRCEITEISSFRTPRQSNFTFVSTPKACIPSTFSSRFVVGLWTNRCFSDILPVRGFLDIVRRPTRQSTKLMKLQSSGIWKVRTFRFVWLFSRLTLSA